MNKPTAPRSTPTEQPPGIENQPSVGLRWLINLRWVAVAGQVLTCVFADRVLNLDVPRLFLSGCIGFTIAGNLWAARLWKKKWPDRAGSMCAGLVFTDTLVLTAMLFATGGAHNPFTAFYLLHITIAAMLLSARAAWMMVGLCAVCFGSLFFSEFTLQGRGGVSCCTDFDFHLQGMLGAMVLSGSCIAYFVGRLRRDIDRREHDLREARENRVRGEKLASLATLAAGIAHELGSPLGTILLAGSDLENISVSGCANNACAEDARLIRSEVERCRRILERLRGCTPDGASEPPQWMRVSDIPDSLDPFLNPEHLLRIDTQLPTEDLRIRVPRTGLLQALGVLVKNGLEAGDDTGRVTLRVAGTTTGIRIEVVDDGRGIAREVAERAGEPFFTTKPPGRGMGLGLFLVRTFVERMGGTFVLESRVEGGTLARLEIPNVRGGTTS